MMKRYAQVAKSAAPYMVILGSFLTGVAWLAPPVRMVVFDHAARMDLLAAHIGLNDPNDGVATHACVNLLDLATHRDDADTLDRLSSRPEIAMACFAALDASHSQGASQDAASEDELPGHSALVPRYQIAAGALGTRWMHALQSGESEHCASAHHARLSLEFSHQDATPGLLTCALNSPSSQARQCCVDELGGAQALAQLLSEPENYTPPDGLRTYASLVETAFPVSDATSDNPTPAHASQQAVQDWVIRVGCKLHHAAPHRTDIIATFVPLIESPSCAPAEADMLKHGFYRPKNWVAICDHLYDYHRVNLTQAPAEALCNALESATTQEAIEQAEFTLFAALDASTRLSGVERRGPGYPMLDLAPSRGGRRSRAIKKNYRSASNQNSPVLSAFFHGLVGH